MFWIMRMWCRRGNNELDTTATIDDSGPTFLCVSLLCFGLSSWKWRYTQAVRINWAVIIYTKGQESRQRIPGMQWTGYHGKSGYGVRCIYTYIMRLGTLHMRL